MPTSDATSQVLVLTTPQLRDAFRDVLHEATAAAREEGRREAEQITTDRRVGYVSNTDAIRLLGMSAQSLARWRAEGLPHAKVRGTVIYRVEDLEAFIEKHRVQ